MVETRAAVENGSGAISNWFRCNYQFSNWSRCNYQLRLIQVHANTAHAEHAAVGEGARQALRDELANEYQLYHYIRWVGVLVLVNLLIPVFSSSM